MSTGDKRTVTPLSSRYYRGHSSGSADYQRYIVGSRNRTARKHSWLKRMATVLLNLW